jgi:hypothetical protein
MALIVALLQQVPSDVGVVVILDLFVAYQFHRASEELIILNLDLLNQCLMVRLSEETQTDIVLAGKDGNRPD